MVVDSSQCPPYSDENVPGVDFMLNSTTYFYQGCVWNRSKAVSLMIDCLHRIDLLNNNATVTLPQCAQFCRSFPDALPAIYGAFSCLSLLCCLGVFITYFVFPRLRQSGYSSKVFLRRTLMDMLIAVTHIVSWIGRLSEAECDARRNGCRVLGIINEFALVASSFWYVILAVDLIKAIRNPFSSQPSYKLLYALTLWGFSFLSALVLITLFALDNHPGEPGQSMFYWCWISIQRQIPDPYINSTRSQPYNFAIVSLFLYYFWHFVFLIFSVCVLIAAAIILKGHLAAASSEIRKFVLKQNAAFVLVLGIEAVLIIPLWMVQLIITSVLENQVDSQCPKFREELASYTYYFWNTDLILAIIFAIVHSSRGILDFIVWFFTFSIRRADIKDVHYRLKKKFSKNSEDLIQPHRRSPLIGKKDGAVNRALRRNAIYCINIGILDAVKLHVEHQGRVARVGSVREEFVAAAMMQLDEERQEERTAELYRNNPNYREQSLRKIQFPASSALRISGFSFIDLEPSVFSSLRNCYGVDPRVYRTSFKIKNAADIESSGMLEKFTEGKSGSFFYFTRDFKYIVKTVTDEEEKFLQKIAYRYYDHMKNNPNSLIVRFFGMHKVRLAREQRYITVVVMDNIFYNREQYKMHERYDLKGSRVGRRSVKKTSKIRREYKGTLKDLDLGDKKIHIGPDSKAQLLGQLRRDVEFLIQCKIMDYSMLLGIHNHNGGEKANRAVVREGSVKGTGDDFVDVEIRNGSGVQYTGTGSASLKSFQDRISSAKSTGYNTRSNARTSTNDSTTESTRPLVVDDEGDIIESQFHLKEEHIAWFREDFGGLRSISPLHPLYKEELQYRGPSVYLDNEQNSSDVSPATYYFGIIDILQQYNWRKKTEHHWKTKVTCKDKHGISCVNEREYGERFLNFMDEIFA